MIKMFRNTIDQLRIVGFIEGISFLLLLFIAMPLKYMLNQPLAVTIVGGLHGVLFVWFMIVLGVVTLRYKWSVKKVAGAILASIIPFGTFVLERKLRDQV